MRVGILADIHSNLEALRAVLEDIADRHVDKLISLGDITGYGACPNECIEIVREVGMESIMGNHDATTCGLEDPWFFRVAAKQAAMWTESQLKEENRAYLRSLPDEINFDSFCLGVHGSPTSRDDYIMDWYDAMRQLEYVKNRPISVVFFGHSHKPTLFAQKGPAHKLTASHTHKLERENIYFINPGAVGQPRDRDARAAYGIIDSNKMIIEFHRIEYDIELCCKKIIDVGLPEELAKRLRVGK